MPRRPEPNDLLVEAPLELLQKLRELQERRAAQVARQMARIDVFAALGYEPNCKVRHDARRAGVPEDDLPPPCGGCPQEVFHHATEYDVLYGGAAGGG